MKKKAIILTSIILICVLSGYAEERYYNNIKFHIVNDSIANVLIDCSDTLYVDYLLGFENIPSMIIAESEFTTLPDKFSEVKGLKELLIKDCPSIDFDKLFYTLNSNKNLRDLAIRRSVNKLPQSISMLDSIMLLDLYQNQIDTIPNEVFQMKSLVSLRLYENDIRKFDVRQDNITLENLQLKQDSLYSLLDDIERFKGLSKLHIDSKSIDIDFNKICKLVGMFPKLKYLNIFVWGLQVDELPKDISNLAKLKLFSFTPGMFSIEQQKKMRELGIKFYTTEEMLQRKECEK